MSMRLFAWSLIAAGLLKPLFAPGAVRADDADAGARVYREALKSVVWIYSPRGQGKAATGTGSLVDRKLRLILTNYHVAGDGDRATVMFPAHKGDRVIAERSYYVDHLRSDGIRGRVVARDRQADLALIQLDSVPAWAVALPLAKEGAAPGQSVHSIGNPGGSGALWVYTPGRVRQVYQKTWQARLDGDNVVTFEANVVETDSATNPGDSGGPLLNDKGQLIGVTQGGALRAQLISTFIDVIEVKHFLMSREVRALGTLDVPKRATEVLTIKDNGHFFSPEAVQKANESIRELRNKYHRDFAIETFMSVPDGQAAKVQAMSADERAAYFRKWARERMRELQVDGIYLLICKEPSHLTLEAPARLETVFDQKAGRKLTELLLTHFREKKYDEGLTEAVRFVSEKLAMSKEK